MMRKVISAILAVALLGVMGYSLWQILGITAEYRGGTDSYDALEEFVVMPETGAVEETASQEITGTADEETTGASGGIRWPEVDFEALAQVNPDVVAWIYVPDTAINYPVVQGEDNKYYLKHLFDGRKNSSGCIFMDCAAEPDFSSVNTALHGHHMKNGSMFAAVCKYKSQDFYDQHPVGLLLTPQGNYEIRFFAGYVCDTKSDAWERDLEGEDYVLWLDRRIRQSYFASDVIPTQQDRVITLSTCSYEYDDARFVVHGVLVEEE